MDRFDELELLMKRRPRSVLLRLKKRLRKFMWRFDSWSSIWMLNLSNFKTKMQNTLKIPKFQNTLKIPKYVKIFNFFPNFPNFGAKFSHVFWGFQSFCTDFSERARKMRKNAAFPVKIGVDKADILAF